MIPEGTVGGGTPRALLYGDVDLNIIDGSAIWAQSMAQALAAAGCSVTFVLKAPVRTDRLTAPLDGIPGVTVRRPYEESLVEDSGGRGLDPKDAVRLMTRLDADERFDLVVVRGRRLAALAAQSEELSGRLWTYLTDVPQSVADITPGAVAELTEIALASRYLLCQTEELRCFLEAVVPAACGRSVLYPPTVVVPELDSAREAGGDKLSLVYTGKFAPRWNTLEMTGLPAALSERGVAAQLHMVGDKIHRDDPEWAKSMERALRDTPGVVWHGGKSRAAALELAASADVGLSWRAPELDASLELSTKVLELGALGLPVVVNRTPMHEGLLGADYPLYAGADVDSVADTLVLARDDGRLEAAAERCRTASADFTLERAAERLRNLLATSHPSPPHHPIRGASRRAASSTLPKKPDRPLRVAVAGHDLKFFTRLADHLMALPGLEIRLDEWEGLSSHDQKLSRELSAWADVVICEWCGPNAVFYARHKRPDQRLIVRLHRFELYAEWPRKLDIDRVDAVVCVSPHYADLTRERTGWPEDKVVVIPNWVDAEQLDRPKLAGAEYTLGMIGIAPCRKRLDRGLDVLAELRRHDPRFTLAVKSKQPWEYWWVWDRPEEREYFERTYRRIQRSEALADSVVFDSYGPDVAAWLRRVGFVLSTSDDESFHLAPAEGAASGAVPAVLAWPGAETIYSRRWVHTDAAAMAEAIHATVDEGRFDADRRAAQAEITASYALRRVRQMWTDLIVFDRRPSSSAADAVVGVGGGGS